MHVEGLKNGDYVPDTPYKIINNFQGSANGQYSFAEKEGKKYFVKAFIKPKYPSDLISGQLREDKIKSSNAFELQHERLLEIFRDNFLEEGQIVYPVDFIRYHCTFMQFSPHVEIFSKNLKNISSESFEKKFLLLKTLTNAISMLHNNRVVHSDLKPDNILVKETYAKVLSAKIIDFDGSYISEDPHPKDFLHFDQSYMAPELSLYNQDDENIEKSMMTDKTDIFSLGIIFHEYITGKRPWISGKEHNDIQYIGDALNSDCEVILSTDILGEKLSGLIRSMIARDYTKRPSATDILGELNAMAIAKSFDESPIPSAKKEPTITTDKLSTGQKFTIITKKK